MEMSCLTQPGKCLVSGKVLCCSQEFLNARASPLLPLVLPSEDQTWSFRAWACFLFTQTAHGPQLCTLRSLLCVTINTEPTAQEGLHAPYIPLLYHSGCSRGARTWLCPYLSKL